MLVVLDRTPFYAEMGDQVADHGYLVSGDAKLKVTQVKKTPKGYFVHTCELLDGTIHVDDEVTASVDEKRRAAICRNHTATHLLHAALRKVLGNEVAQKGSNITAERLRFDFSFGRKVTKDELAQVEKMVNEAIQAKVPVVCEEMTVPEAKEKGAIGLFESKYGEKVRTYKMGDYSFEICGGPHAQNTGDLGTFKIQKEESSSAGVRRIKAVLIPDQK